MWRAQAPAPETSIWRTSSWLSSFSSALGSRQHALIIDIPTPGSDGLIRAECSGRFTMDAFNQGQSFDLEAIV
jgi:hypothetical protein